MIPEYLPILKAKKGEFDALKKLDSNASAKFLPLFELPRLTDKMLEAKKYNGVNSVTALYLNGLIQNIVSVRKGLSCHIDTRAWAPNATTEEGEHVLGFTYERLVKQGVNVHPVIGYDLWDDIEYQQAIVNLSRTYDTKYCIRLESDALDDLDDPEYFIERIQEILAALMLEPSSCSILVDFRDVTKRSIVDLQEDFEKVTTTLSPFQFNYIALAGCSLSGNIADAVEDIDSTGMVLRKEVIAWKALKRANISSSCPIVFGDYAIRNPNAADGVIAPHANGKIRYTIADNYFIARGHSMQYGDKGAQTHRLAAQIVNSGYFLGEPFSWGDAYVAKCSRREVGRGNSTTWISVDTNHHIKAVLMEVFEFNRQFVKAPEISIAAI